MQNKDLSLISHLAHDLNNILTRIVNSVELLKMKVELNDDTKSLLSSIENGTFMASEIIEDVISESAHKTVRKKRININSLIEDLANTLGVQLKNKITFDLKLDRHLNFIEARYSDLYRVIMNLIINSVEAIKEKGTISIITSNIGAPKQSTSEPKLFDQGSYVQIKVIDNGNGIDSSILPYIFDEKFSTKAGKKNRGFGLAIVKKIIEDWSGTIKIISDNGKGTEFTIMFPAVQQIETESSKSVKLILVAEDEDIQRELLVELLESYNYRVVSASTGKEVMKYLSKKEIPDLLIIDQKMPDIDGIACIKKIKAKKLKIPIILASGSLEDASEKSGVKNSINKIICKPYNFDEMLSVIKELIG